MPRAGPLRYWLLTLTGVGLALASIAAFDWGSYHLSNTGSCESGGGAISTLPECPDDTALHIWAVVVGPLVGFIAIIFLALRGSAPGSRRVGLDSVLWAVLFCSMGGTALYAGFGPDAAGDARKLAAVVLAAVFIPMGLAPFVFSTALAVVRRRPRRLQDRIARGEAPMPTVGRPAPARPVPSLTPLNRTSPPATWEPNVPGPRPSPATAVERLQQLDQLKAKGLITVAELEAQKKRILGGV